MIRGDALNKAAECARLAQAESDPERRVVLCYLSDLWSELAEDATLFSAQQVKAQYLQLLSVEAMLRGEPTVRTLI